MAILPGQALVKPAPDGGVNVLCTRCNHFTNRRPLRPTGHSDRDGVTVADLIFEVNEHRCAL